MKPMSGNLSELIVSAVKTSISPAEAYNVAIVLPWLSEILGRTGKNFVTANLSDLIAFCDERAKTRNERSMDRLIANLRVIFDMLVNEGLRNDNPARLLPSPGFTVVSTNYSIKRADIDDLISWQGHRLQQANAFAYPFQLRRLVLICLLAAGITVAELERLDTTDRLANGVKAGRNEMRERPVHLDDVASSAMSRWLEHRATIPVGDGAMFPSFHPPWTRLQLKSISRAVSQLIEDAGPRFSHLTPRTLCRSMYAAIVEDGLGWALAIGAGGRKTVPHVVRSATSIEQLALMVERFHPLGSPTPSPSLAKTRPRGR